MTITQQIRYIQEHPYYELAKRDDEAMSLLLFEAMFHTYQVCSLNCARAYKFNKSRNIPQILEALRDCPPPENLNLMLPIPPVECVVVPINNPASISVAGEDLEKKEG